MALHTHISCDACGSVSGPFWVVIFKTSPDPTKTGARFDLCIECVTQAAAGLPREEGDSLPPIAEPTKRPHPRARQESETPVAPVAPTTPICECGATEYMEGSRAEYCEKGHPIDPTETGFGPVPDAVEFTPEEWAEQPRSVRRLVKHECGNPDACHVFVCRDELNEFCCGRFCCQAVGGTEDNRCAECWADTDKYEHSDDEAFDLEHKKVGAKHGGTLRRIFDWLRKGV